ncbi:family 43 glycosylhydrolase [Pontiellaceae bacterium B12219]|nr:family 43 glycosylhydrolase [Pontiellaceae bacterium B12219]
MRVLFIICVICFIGNLHAAERATNPFIKHMFTADPSAHVWDDGRLYVYPSTDIEGSTNYRSMDGYHVFSTDDMLNWTDHGEILHSRDVYWSDVSGSMWAPDCAYKDGIYYYYFPHTNNDGVWEIGIATSTNPASDFTVQGFVNGGTTYADPCVFIDDDGQAYLYAVVDKQCHAARLKENMVEIDGEMVRQEELYAHREGPFVFKREGIYYCIYPDSTTSGHQMRYAMSDSPLGPWESKGVILEKTSSYTSHGSIVEYKGTWYLFYHNADLSGGLETNRSICFDVVTFNEDGTINLVEQTQDELYQPPDLPVLSNIVYTASGSEETEVPSVSTNDLAQTQYLSSSATGRNELGNSGEHAQLFNGTPGDTVGDSSDPGEVTLDSGNTLTVTLDTSVNADGYDLTGIDSYFGWSTGNGGRSNQGYEIIVTYVDGSSAKLVEPNHWAPNSPALYWTTVSFREVSGGVMASGVKSVTFNFTEDANAGGVVIGREIDIFGVPTGTESLPVLPGIVYEASGSSSAPSVSTNDLAQTQYLSSSATGGNEVANEHAQLFNGTAGNDVGDSSDSGEVTMGSGNTITVTFDTSVNTLGYDLTGIDSYFGWTTGSGGRANQGYKIIVIFVDGSRAVLAGPEHWAPNSPASYWTTVSFRKDSGGVMASGVKSIVFYITEDANAGGVVVGREIDIFGVPTVSGGPHIPVFEPGLTVSNGNLMVSFSGTVGQHYRVESSDDLISSNSWQVVTDLAALATSPMVVSSPMTNNASFYRVILVQ